MSFFFIGVAFSEEIIEEENNHEGLVKRMAEDGNVNVLSDLIRSKRSPRRSYNNNYNSRYRQPSCGPFQRRACFPRLRTALVLGATALGGALLGAGISQQLG